MFRERLLHCTLHFAPTKNMILEMFLFYAQFFAFSRAYTDTTKHVVVLY